MTGELETITLERLRSSDEGTFGVLKRSQILTSGGQINRRIAVTCELPWRDNQNKVSCIPRGTYKVTRFKSPSKGDVFLLHDVPGRAMIEIHSGNTIKDIEGCILPGTDFGFVSGLPAVINSRVALRALQAELPETFNLQISGVV